MKKLITLIILLLLNIALYGAENGKPQEEQKSCAQQEILHGKLSIIGEVHAMKKHPNNYQKEILKDHYGELSDDEPLVRVDYSSKECRDWTHHKHPKFNDQGELSIEYLPVLKPIAYIVGEDKEIQAKIEETLMFPRGIPALISSYAHDKVALLDVKHGSTIELELPTDGTVRFARLICRGYNGNYEKYIKNSLLNAHYWENSLEKLDDVLSAKLKADLAIIEQQEAEASAKWSKEFDEEWAKERQKINQDNNHGQNSCRIS